MKQYMYYACAITAIASMQLAANENSSFDMSQLRKTMPSLKDPLDVSKSQKQLSDAEAYAQYVCSNLDRMAQIERRLSNSSLEKVTDILSGSNHHTKSTQSKISVIIEKELSSKEFNEWQEARDDYNQALFVLETFHYCTIKQKLYYKENA